MTLLAPRLNWLSTRSLEMDDNLEDILSSVNLSNLCTVFLYLQFGTFYSRLCRLNSKHCVSAHCAFRYEDNLNRAVSLTKARLSEL